ncbi:DNA replication terminus site-binding protein (plasmid) [Halopseudomonas sp. SMJS2]|uniref:DNA replication terminus site-binding protein n=1 Tax=Halopseudomonas sp. SMJS2 TaxID=3041098 RepID=UPI0024534087|nr:DNA replication terminus site-binding protein [Halopseudomonas sp. SMJS2]WGK63341.1 DNA replication terminus site-binding protein [Halopseudomonas sp. SMJS2]
MVHISPSHHALELIDQLDSELKDLAADMRSRSGSIRIDALWEIPLRSAPLVDSKAPIEISAPEREEAELLVIEILTSLWMRIGQSMRETIRAPGAIGLLPQWIDTIARTNLLRSQIYEVIKPLSQQQRVNIWRRHNGISALQTMRITPILRDPVAIRFYWDATPSIKRVKAWDLAGKLEQQLIDIHGHVPRTEELPEDSVDRKTAFSVEMLRILDSHEAVAIYREGKPHVRVRVHDGDDSPYIAQASVPYVYNHQCPSVRITPLVSYEPHASERPRSSRARIEAEPYVESLYIHRYLPCYRAWTAKDEQQNKPERHTRKKA